VNGGHDERMELTGFIYTHEIEQSNLFNCFKWEYEGVAGGDGGAI
jgi:hypothetical protein